MLKRAAMEASHGVRLAVIVPALLLASMALPSWGGDQGNLRLTGTQPLEPPDVSMAQAIRNIESATGGRVLNVDTDPLIKPIPLLKVPLVYGLLTVQDQVCTVYFVDVATGMVLQKSPDWFNHWRKNTLVRSGRLARATITLGQAVVLAEGKTGGKAVQARTREDGDTLTYQVTTVAGGRTRRVHIDAATGRLTEPLADEPKPGLLGR